MKIVHLCLSNFYIDNFGYQENILPKYNKDDGHEVTIIASRFTYQKGKPGLADVGEYINADGIKVIRIDYKYRWLGPINDKLKIYRDTYKTIEQENPDLIFCHGIQFWDLHQVSRYVKNNPECKLIADNHAANINSARNILSRQILHKLIYKIAIQRALPFISMVYVLAPGCRDFAKEMYHIPDDKMSYLYLGADTKIINFDKKDEISLRIREELNLSSDDFLFITGGKLRREKNIELLLRAIRKVHTDRFKLIIFGDFSNDIKDEMLKLIDEDRRVQFIGWLKGEEVYDYYMAADAAIFPGTKSALWEQAICCGLPLICRRWVGMEYVDVGGNCIFIEGENENEIVQSIYLLMKNGDVFREMKLTAETIGYETFSYERISKQVLA
jgi:1,2-diacylglycerol 3-alpha-glucosyltransferase